MVRLNRIYTRTGDTGTTGLVGGARVSKSAPLMDAIGDVDEANSAIGLAVLAAAAGGTMAQDLARGLARIQNDLFDLGADIATPGEGGDYAPSDMQLRIVAAQVERLEREIDAMNETLPPLGSFILPGGGAVSAALHLARSVTRRAERSAIRVAEPLNPQALAYLNRLSDWLFVAARFAGGTDGDVLWKPGATR